MDRISTFLAIIRPLALLLGAAGALLVARDPGLELQTIPRDSGPATTQRGRAILWLILTGLIAAPFRVLLTEIVGWINILPGPERIRPIPVSSLLLSLGALAGLLFGFLLTWLLLRRGDWAVLRLRTGWRPSPLQHVFLWLALGLFLAWPVVLPIQLVGTAVAASGLSDLPALLGWFSVLQSVVAYGLALWSAGSILRQLGHRWEPFFQSRGRLTLAALLVAATGLLAHGVLELFQTVNRTLNGLIPAIGDSVASGPLAGLILDALPVLAYLVAIPIVRAIDWEAIAARTGWRTSALDEVLVYLTLAAWLAWPFGLPALIVRSLLPMVAPRLTVTLQHVVLATVVLVLLYLLLLYNPSREPEERVEG